MNAPLAVCSGISATQTATHAAAIPLFRVMADMDEWERQANGGVIVPQISYPNR
ncbi:hypothetical protein DSCA_16350 [Desulfosarcina alkanivorans]|uniref:Uncharacterized protein n=1 Tax=Desulfosarcina alkanivorans TaxID=571177 RepID=A0A5K7YH16_9BACT|nr:hypothetical protein [Desulfosarcina alkanivorans]BBO67705.1 hypothetical protein DSCA_16350 [Desulfosarcina alkanivorans]